MHDSDISLTDAGPIDPGSMPFPRRRFRAAIVLSLAALVIVALCAWKLTRPPRAPSTRQDISGPRLPAPVFVLRDQQSQRRRVRLATFLGRHRILVAFFDAGPDLQLDPLLRRLKERSTELDRAGIKVFAISAAAPDPYDNLLRREGPFPFPVLRDPNGFVCAKWGRLDPQSETTHLKTLPGLFVIDRAGNVAVKEERAAGDAGGVAVAPAPETDPLHTIDALASGE